MTKSQVTLHAAFLDPTRRGEQIRLNAVASGQVQRRGGSPKVTGQGEPDRPILNLFWNVFQSIRHADGVATDVSGVRAERSSRVVSAVESSQKTRGISKTHRMIREDRPIGSRRAKSR